MLLQICHRSYQFLNQINNMSKLSGLRRKLNPQRVEFAQHIANEKIRIAREVVIERAKKDKKFAEEIIKMGEAIIPEIRKACEESINSVPTNESFKEQTKALVEKWDKTELLEGIKDDLNPPKMSVIIESQPKQIIEKKCCVGPSCGCDKTDELVPYQTDGGGIVLKHPTEMLDYPRDGAKV